MNSTFGSGNFEFHEFFQIIGVFLRQQFISRKLLAISRRPLDILIDILLCMQKILLYTYEITNDTFLINIFGVMAIVPYWGVLTDFFFSFGTCPKKRLFGN